MDKQTALNILDEMITNPSLRAHCLSVGLVCEAYAKQNGLNADDYFIAGLLHDADYEKYPDEHPQVIVAQLQEQGLTEIAQAISCHGRSFGIPAVSLMDKVLMASDELSGFVMACAKIRPDGLTTLDAHSVAKKFRTPKFAAGVGRDEVEFALEQLGVEFDNYTQFIIESLRPHAGELNLPG